MVNSPSRSSGSWFILLPVPSHPKPERPTVQASDSGINGFRPHLQRRDREGIAPSSLTPEL
jgi:hypothetical protein